MARSQIVGLKKPHDDGKIIAAQAGRDDHVAFQPHPHQHQERHDHQHRFLAPQRLDPEDLRRDRIAEEEGPGDAGVLAEAGQPEPIGVPFDVVAGVPRQRLLAQVAVGGQQAGGQHQLAHHVEMVDGDELLADGRSGGSARTAAGPWRSRRKWPRRRNRAERPSRATPARPRLAKSELTTEWTEITSGVASPPSSR